MREYVMPAYLGSEAAAPSLWNSIQGQPHKWIAPAPSRLTTELRVVVPHVEAAALCGHAAQPLANGWRSELLFSPTPSREQSVPGGEAPRAVAQIPSLPVNVWLRDAARSYVDPAWSGAAGERDLSGLQPVQVAAGGRPAFANRVAPIEARINRLGSGPDESPTAVLLWEVATVFGPAREREVQPRAGEWEWAKAMLEQIRQRLSRALLPPPSLAAVPAGAAAVRVRGRGGGARAQTVTAVILDSEWEVERTLDLPVRRKPRVQRGQLNITLDVGDPSLVGRVADLIFTVEGMEIGLSSSTIEHAGDELGISFGLDLDASGIEVSEGDVPLNFLRVIVEPLGQEDRGADQDDR